MDEQMKDRILIAMMILVVICLILTISSSVAAQRSKKSLHKEVMLRMDAEEKLLNLTDQTESLKASLNTELQNAKANLEGVTKALEDQKVINEELRQELLKTTKLKQALEEDLKEALVNCKK